MVAVSTLLAESPRLGHEAPFTHFLDVLRHRATRAPERLALTFGNGVDAPASYTYAQLDQAAQAFGARLQALGAAGERVVILLQPSAEYVLALLGCWYAGATAVPVFSPKFNASYERVRLVVEDAHASVLISTRAVVQALDAGQWSALAEGALRTLAVDDAPVQPVEAWQVPTIDAGSLAVLQYTSGSTGAPKGVRLLHRHLLANSAMIQQAMASSTNDVGVVWLPPYHDMGLIGGLLQPLYVGYPVHLMAPATFLQRPLRWLEAISRLGGTVSAAPNFAYELCARRLKPEQVASLDLSRWRLAANGAEPIRQSTLELFSQVFSPAGFDARAFAPCYGMAETTLLVAASAPDAAPVTLRADRQALLGGTVRPAACDDAVVLVSSGTPAAGARVLIVDPQRLDALPAGQVGEVWVAGPMVADGYWNNTQATQTTFHATLEGGEHLWLRTGDLGALVEGQLYVTGRLKDVIIIHGHNHYPTDLEDTVGKLDPAIRAQGVAAYARELGGEEALGLVVEVERSASEAELAALRVRIIEAVSQVHQLRVGELLLVAPNSLPRTSSGKLQRARTRQAVEQGVLQALVGRVQP
ncbi:MULTISPECIES: fatty acyl-AMP ligase [unclassified Pseudomonas]|uniref:fatty acyl-AMP ligase n=1 Tax=unclassified Pseudomonas TaxID=196821 RepID=UPI000BD6F63C|nr:MULTISPECIES: fatty acyl-AMP ligase [unclassified Pseudomonas]PVZ16363.1 acyl-CoA synthetase (AMP-forming)/AMP-acid ligase II [Pseudomonas sp. URIL14HWK12:I12]PVZ25781.1 acyl-CoA synthetase (AMP-forming)/AMP-acid ligase II [Pseudomonas sp. URIL14HWK12:I10]PVZ36695.1 acyl-CoA synthetase (AMP-forming)/AMP-acid ligase II [Pseudomonas sp. URIL14HWK12:I11]SNZ12801.1 Acyl-CoA synthetase (AMP-forming)/AMP-acid ligase II [Pseudomonas sp. URIL14HWK12:I9]